MILNLTGWMKCVKGVMLHKQGFGTEPKDMGKLHEPEYKGINKDLDRTERY